MKVYHPLLFKFVFTYLLLIFFISCSKDTTTRRTGGPTPPDVEVISNVQYGVNTNMNGNTVNLGLDIYIPAGATASQKFPFILFVHGGGFTAGDKASSSTSMEQYANAGFVAVSIDYRVDSVTETEIDPCAVDTVISEKTVYMSVQDARAAMRFMVANAAKYHIDTSKIFFDGNSAGAITILNSYFLTQNDFNKAIPNVESELGGINNADNSLTNTFNIIGIGANSGALPNPDYITASNAVPIIFFHGGQDSVIPVVQGHAYYCSNTLYLYGSKTLYNRMVDLNKTAVLHIDPTGEHGPYTQDFLTNNKICFFNSILNKRPEKGSYSAQASSCN